jgi:hypothetical protein
MKKSNVLIVFCIGMKNYCITTQLSAKAEAGKTYSAVVSRKLKREGYIKPFNLDGGAIYSRLYQALVVKQCHLLL